MNSAEFLDAVRVKHGLTSDYQVAKRFEIPLPSISNYRTGRRSFDDATCIKIASALGEQPLYVIASIKAGRAKCTEVKGVWEYCAKIGKSIKINGAGVLTVVSVGVLAGLSDLAAAGQCILCKVRRLWALLALCGAIAVTAGCAASPQEKVWQAMHLVDVAQTINGPARDPHYDEFGSAGFIIGEQPSVESVIAWGVAMAIGHYALDRWLTRTGRADKGWIKILRGIDLGYKGFVIGGNHACGIRVFGDNARIPKCWGPGFGPGSIE